MDPANRIDTRQNALYTRNINGVGEKGGRNKENQLIRAGKYNVKVTTQDQEHRRGGVCVL